MLSLGHEKARQPLSGSGRKNPECPPPTNKSGACQVCFMSNLRGCGQGHPVGGRVSRHAVATVTSAPRALPLWKALPPPIRHAHLARRCVKAIVSTIPNQHLSPILWRGFNRLPFHSHIPHASAKRPSAARKAPTSKSGGQIFQPITVRTPATSGAGPIAASATRRSARAATWAMVGP